MSVMELSISEVGVRFLVEPILLLGWVARIRECPLSEKKFIWFWYTTMLRKWSLAKESWFVDGAFWIPQ